jgi:hypothetical protein
MAPFFKNVRRLMGEKVDEVAFVFMGALNFAPISGRGKEKPRDSRRQTPPSFGCPGPNSGWPETVERAQAFRPNQDNRLHLAGEAL